MSLSKIMSTTLITLDMDSTLSDAKTIFAHHKIHHLLIVDERNELMGIITDRDLYKHLSPTLGTIKETHQDLVFQKKKVHLIMSRNPVTATKDISLKQAVLLLHENHISCLPIVNEQDELVGIVTWRDILKLLAEHFS